MTERAGSLPPSTSHRSREAPSASTSWTSRRRARPAAMLLATAVPAMAVAGVAGLYTLRGWSAGSGAIAAGMAVLLAAGAWCMARRRSAEPGTVHAGAPGIGWRQVLARALAPGLVLAAVALTCCAVVLAGTAADAADRARATGLLVGSGASAGDRSPREQLTVRTTGATARIQDGVLVEAVLEDGAAKGAQVLVVLGQDAAPREPARGSSWTAWFAVSTPRERGPEALQLRAVSAPLSPVCSPQDPLTHQRAALARLFAPEAAGGGAGADGAALVPGMVAGDRSLQSLELSAVMNAAGLSHLSAVSGANIALLLAAVASSCRLLRVPRWLRTPLGLLVLVAFVLLVGPEPSVARAAVMGALSAVAVVAGRPRASLALLGTAVVVLVALDPWQVGRAAFQLSVLACLGIALGSVPLTSALRLLRCPRLLAESTAVSVAATLACTPVLIGLDTEQSLLTIPVNVLAAPCAAVVGTLGPLLLLLAPLGRPWLAPLALTCRLPASAVAGLGRVAAERGPHVTWPEGAPGFVLAVTVCWLLPAVGLWAVTRWAAGRPPPVRSARRTAGVAAWLRTRRRREQESSGQGSSGQVSSGAVQGDLGSGTEDGAADGAARGGGWGMWTRRGGGSPWVHPYRVHRRRRLWRRRAGWAAMLAGAVAAGLGAAAVGPPPWRTAGGVGPGDLVLCDVGQGDATLLVGQDGSGILIDAGPEDGDAAGCVARAGVKRLCAAIGTHLDADHVGGLPKVLAGVPADAVLYGTADRQPPVEGARRGAQGQEVDCAPWTLVVVSAPQSASDENDASLIVRATDTSGAGIDLLAGGDVEDEAARSAVASGVADAAHRAPGSVGDPVRVLKISHHGSANGGTALQDAFVPDVALIGVGAHNDYGHPNRGIVEGLVGHGVRVLRTDTDGTVLLHPVQQGVAVGVHR